MYRDLWCYAGGALAGVVETASRDYGVWFMLRD